MSEDEYNGWTNYETWVVMLWIDNVEGLYNYWQEVTKETWDNAEPAWDWESKEDRAVYELAQKLESYYNDILPDTHDGIFTDLINHALGRVNWREIAYAMIQEVQENEDTGDQ